MTKHARPTKMPLSCMTVLHLSAMGCTTLHRKRANMQVVMQVPRRPAHASGASTPSPGTQEAGRGRSSQACERGRHRSGSRGRVDLQCLRSPLRGVADMLEQDRSQKHQQGERHTFDDFPLDRLGTHSFKRSAVVLMKDTCTSTALVGAIAGTTAKTLDRVYDMPTLRRQHGACGESFQSRGGRVAPSDLGGRCRRTGRGTPGDPGPGRGQREAPGRPGSQVLLAVRGKPRNAGVGVLPTVWASFLSCTWPIPGGKPSKRGRQG